MTLKKVIIKNNKTVREKLELVTGKEILDKNINNIKKKFNEKQHTSESRKQEFDAAQEKIDAIHHEKIKDVFKEHSCVANLWSVEKKEEALNCHAYALGIHESETLLTRLGNHSGEVAFIDGNKMQSLIKEEYLTELEKPIVGSLVLYFDDMQSDKLTHTGIIKELREDGNHIVESKWGDIRAIFTHSISEVPTVYGNYVAYFKKPSLEEIENMLGQILETENS